MVKVDWSVFPPSWKDHEQVSYNGKSTPLERYDQLWERCVDSIPAVWLVEGPVRLELWRIVNQLRSSDDNAILRKLMKLGEGIAGEQLTKSGEQTGDGENVLRALARFAKRLPAEERAALPVELTLSHMGCKSVGGQAVARTIMGRRAELVATIAPFVKQQGILQATRHALEQCVGSEQRALATSTKGKKTSKIADAMRGARRRAGVSVSETDHT